MSIRPHDLHRAEGGNLPARDRSFQGLARPHSARQTRDCTSLWPSRCACCAHEPHASASLTVVRLHFRLSAGVAHLRWRTCTSLIDYKLDQRYGLALRTPARRHVTLAARSAAAPRAPRRRPLRWCSHRTPQAPARDVFGAIASSWRLQVPTLRDVHAGMRFVRGSRRHGAHGLSTCVPHRSTRPLPHRAVGPGAASECSQPRPQEFNGRSEDSKDRRRRAGRR